MDTIDRMVSAVLRNFGVVGDEEPSHKSRARVAGYFQMSRWDMDAERWPMIENQSCGQFSSYCYQGVVRHYPIRKLIKPVIFLIRLQEVKFQGIAGADDVRGKV